MRIQSDKLPAALTGAILAGGKGRRMGNVNKGLVLHHGRHLFEYAVNNMRHHVKDLVIVTNSESERYQALGYEAIGDGEYRGMGPLAGFLAALSYSPTSYVAFAACDQGMLPDDVYPRLFETAKKSVSGAAILSDGKNIFPTCAVLSVELKDSLRSSLSLGQCKLMLWCDEIAAAHLIYTGLDFINYNSPDDLVLY